MRLEHFTQNLAPAEGAMLHPYLALPRGAHGDSPSPITRSTWLHPTRRGARAGFPAHPQLGQGSTKPRARVGRSGGSPPGCGEGTRGPGAARSRARPTGRSRLRGARGRRREPGVSKRGRLRAETRPWLRLGCDQRCLVTCTICRGMSGRQKKEKKKKANSGNGAAASLVLRRREKPFPASLQPWFWCFPAQILMEELRLHKPASCSCSEQRRGPSAPRQGSGAAAGWVLPGTRSALHNPYECHRHICSEREK